MKEKFLALVSQIEDIRKTAYEEHVEGFFDSDTATLKYRLGELKEILTKEFGLRSMSSAIWERRRDEFM